MSSFSISTGTPPSEEAELVAFLNTLFSKGSEAYLELTYALIRQNRANGAPEIKNIRFETARFAGDKHQGAFRVVFDVEFTFACEGSVTNKKNLTSDWTFTFDEDKKLLVFQSAAYDEPRSTDEEF